MSELTWRQKAILEILLEDPGATESEVIAYLMPEFSQAVMSDINKLQDEGKIRRGRNDPGIIV